MQVGSVSRRRNIVLGNKKSSRDIGRLIRLSQRLSSNRQHLRESSLAGGAAMNMNEMMLETYKTNLAKATDPLDKASYAKLIAKYEKRIAAAKQ